MIMTERFFVFLEQGFTHILDPKGLDHVLFLLAICAIYSYKDWKQVLWIITSFTIAHSVTLALCALDLVNIDAGLVEFLIAFSIFFTAAENLFFRSLDRYRVIISGMFGLIHGMGFSRLLKELFTGMEFDVWSTLLPFNIGLEAGQVIIVSMVISLIFILNRYARLNARQVNYLLSVPVLICALYWLYERNIFL